MPACTIVWLTLTCQLCDEIIPICAQSSSAVEIDTEQLSPPPRTVTETSVMSVVLTPTEVLTFCVMYEGESSVGEMLPNVTRAALVPTENVARLLGQFVFQCAKD